MNRPLLTILVCAGLLFGLGAADTAGAATRHHSRSAASRSAAAAARSAKAPANSRNPVTTAAAIAEGYWGATPCGGQIRVQANTPLATGLDPTTDGWVTFGSSLGSDNLSAPASTYTACTISLAHWKWASWSDMESDWGMFCLTVVHEMGHLLGHQHSNARGSVMAPVFTSNANVPSLCNKTWLKGWR